MANFLQSHHLDQNGQQISGEQLKNKVTAVLQQAATVLLDVATRHSYR